MLRHGQLLLLPLLLLLCFRWLPFLRARYYSRRIPILGLVDGDWLSELADVTTGEGIVRRDTVLLRLFNRGPLCREPTVV